MKRTVLIVGALGVGVWWLSRRMPDLGPPSPEMMQYLGQPVRPPVWETWGDYALDWYTNGWSWEPVSETEAARAREAAQEINDSVGWSPTTGGIW